MKKIVSLMVAVMMLCMLTVTAFAATSPEADNKEITATVQLVDGKAVADLGKPGESVAAGVTEATVTYTDPTTSTVKTVKLTYNATTGKWESTDAGLIAALGAAAAPVITASAPAAAAGAAGPASFAVSGAAAATGTAAGVSPQTGETVAVYAVAAVVMAAAAAAFVVKARKA